MERLTHPRCSGIKTGYWSPNKKDELIERLAAYEDTDLSPEEIKALRKNGKTPEHRWIPVEERLPEPNTRVLVTLKHHRWISDYDSVLVPESEKIAYPEYTEVCEAVYMPDIGWKYAEAEDDYGEAFAFIEPEEDRSCPVVEVIAWMPLPEPYRRGEKR